MCCDSPTNPNQDPQVQQAALMQAKTAQDALDFSKDYYTNTEKPLVDQTVSASKAAQEQQGKLFDLNYADAQLNDKQYRTYGIPAQQKYYDTVNQYSQEGEFERRAREAAGDVTNSAAVQGGITERNLASRGISGNSGAAIATRASTGLGTMASRAAAANSARDAARTLGLQLTGDAANFGRGGASSVIGFGNAAGGNSSSGYQISANTADVGNRGASVPMAGYGLATNAYGQQMGTYMSGAQTYSQAQAQADAGLGNFIGSAYGMYKSSDRRLKTNIVRVGTRPDGIGVYEFDYIGGATGQVGVMADEVELVMPAAVLTRPDGFKMVNYGMLG